MSAGLETRALLVTLNISAWNGERSDREVSAEVIASKRASADAGRFVKLLVGEKALDGVKAAANELRKAFRRGTLPWAESTGILPARAFLDFTASMEGLRAIFEAEADAFAARYPALLAEAEARLGGMFKAADYPEAGEVRARFGVRVAAYPVPSADFRVGLSAEAEAELRLRLAHDVDERARDASKALIERVAATVAHFHEIMSDPDAMFRNSTVRNVGDMAEAAARLVLEDDGTLAALLDEIRALARVEPDALRELPTKRAEAASEAKAALDKLSEKLRAYA